MQTKRSEIEHLNPGGASGTAHMSAPVDETDYEHRHFVNLLAIVFLLAVAGAIIWTVRAMEDNEKLQRCLNAGRRDCVKIETPPSTGVRLPVR
jgi:hypothetical protein